MYAFCCLSANLFRSWNKQQHNNNLIITGFKTQHMNCYQQHSSIKSNQKLYSFIYFSICDCRMLWNSTFPPLTPDTREALTYLWGIESSKLLKIVFPPFLFSFFILFFFWSAGENYFADHFRPFWPEIQHGRKQYNLSNRQQVERWRRWRWVKARDEKNGRAPEMTNIDGNFWIF